MKEENENNYSNERPGNFGLPEGYFQKSAGSIMNKIEWQEEHKDFPRLTELKTDNGFLTPENYFTVNEKNLELINYPILNKLKSQNAFSIPSNYFEEFEIAELAKVIVDSETQFAKLEALKKESSFKLPENYFEKSSKSISSKIKIRKEAKVISLFTKRIRFAAAAIFVIVTGVWLYNFYFPAITPIDCGTIACLDKQDIVKSKSIESLEDEQLYELVDPSALKKKLDSNNNIQTKSKDSSEKTFVEEELLDGDI